MESALLLALVNLGLQLTPQIFALIAKYRDAGTTHVTIEQLAADAAKLDGDIADFDATLPVQTVPITHVIQAKA